MNDVMPENALPVMPATGQEDFIRSRIFTIRGVQVMLDSDLAKLYHVSTSSFNQAVKRNESRFPGNFRFRLTKDEYVFLMSQIVISKPGDHETRGGRQKLPYVFTEQGVAMLSGILRSEVAVRTSIAIMNTFVAMRKALASVSPLLVRMDAMERRQITDQSRNEERFDEIFKAMDGGDFPPQKVFFEGRHYEAYSFVRKLVRKATKSLVLVDGYCDDTTLDILAKKPGGVRALLATSAKTLKKSITPTAIDKFNRENPTLSVCETGVFHDRFLIIDDKELYHFGASFKDLGRQYCAVSKLDPAFIASIMDRVNSGVQLGHA